MCGIAGILNLNRFPVAPSHLQAMTDILAHRGPDGEGQYIDEYVGLGHRRLAIIDLSASGHQPMQTPDGRYTITYNGELYNFKELRVALEAKGCLFRSHTDTEVILYAYATWGPHCLEKFNGMFAFGIWDAQEKKLFLTRDRYGIKPLYYYHSEKSFIFASEIKALIASGLYKPTLDQRGLIEYLTFQNFFTDQTLFQDVHLLMPGHYATLGLDGRLDKEKYWDFSFQSTLSMTEEEAVEELDRLFQQAVQRQLVSDVPINSYLSGGIDSGAITMVASQFIPHLRTFTIGFDLNSASGLELSFDERVKAEHISYLAKTEHYEMVLKAGDMERCMERFVYHLEEPRVGQSYPNYYAAKLASKFGKVVLAGTGSDELFGGYPWRYFYRDNPYAFQGFVEAYYASWQRLVSNSQLKELLSPIQDVLGQVWTRDIFEDVFKDIRKDVIEPEDYLNYSLYLEKTFLHGLLVVEDKLSMAHSLETRVPFLDNDLVDFAMRIPPSLKVQRKEPLTVNENELLEKGQTRERYGKHILKKTLSRHLSDDIVNAPKQGFSAPDASWFRGESIEYVKKELCHPGTFLSQFFDGEVFERILNSHFKGQTNKRLLIWSCLNLEMLGRTYFGHAP